MDITTTTLIGAIVVIAIGGLVAGYGEIISHKINMLIYSISRKIERNKHKKTPNQTLTKKEAIDLLIQGKSREWNSFRDRNPNWKPDLQQEDLKAINFVPRNKPAFDRGCTKKCVNGSNWTAVFKANGKLVEDQGPVRDGHLPFLNNITISQK